MKKFLFLIVILLIALGLIYRMDVKPEAKEVVKDVSAGKQANTNNTPINAAK